MKKIQLWADAQDAIEIYKRLDVYFTEKQAQYEGELLDAKREFKNYVLENNIYRMKNSFTEIKDAKRKLLELAEMKAYLDSVEDIEDKLKTAA